MPEPRYFCEGIKLPFETLTNQYCNETIDFLLKHPLLDGRSFSVIFTGDDFIAEMNREYREKEGPTDVISFPQEDDFPGETSGEAGEIYISLDRAFSQADDFENTFLQEVDRLLVHGFLHLMGYDHEAGENEARIMSEKEEELLADILKIHPTE